MSITVTLTAEELCEARFCVRHYSALYPGHPNDHFQTVRDSIAAKLGAAYSKWADEHEAELEGLKTEEQYIVQQNPHGRCFEVKGSSPLRTKASFFYGGDNPAYTEEEAEAAAKDECERLNAKKRKENHR